MDCPTARVLPFLNQNRKKPMSTLPLLRDYPANLHVALANFGISIRDADRISLALSNDQDETAMQILMDATGMDERGACIALREAIASREGRSFSSRSFRDTMELLPA
jgi:hypothetical protein